MIALEELIHCGADTFVRVGTLGGMQPNALSGSVVIATGAIRRVRVGTVLLVIGNQTRREMALEDIQGHDTENRIRVAVEALTELIETDKK